MSNTGESAVPKPIPAAESIVSKTNASRITAGTNDPNTAASGVWRSSNVTAPIVTTYSPANIPRRLSVFGLRLMRSASGNSSIARAAAPVTADWPDEVVPVDADGVLTPPSACADCVSDPLMCELVQL